MNRLVADKKEAYFSMTQRYVYKNHMLDFILPISKVKFKEKEIKVLTLFNKYFPSYKIMKLNIERSWEDFILYNEYLKFDWDSQICTYFQIPFYYNIGNDIQITNASENGASIFLEIDQDNQEVCILTFRPNVFTNQNYIDVYRNKSWEKIWVDQTKSATLNRKRISSFLEEFETVLETKIIEATSGYINKRHINMHGVNEDAVLEL